MKKNIIIFIVIILLAAPNAANALWCKYTIPPGDSNGTKQCKQIGDTAGEKTTCGNAKGSVETTDCTAWAEGVSESSGSSSGDTVSLDNPLSGAGATGDPSALIGLIIKSFLGIVGGLALAMTVYGGFQWLTSAGNQEKVKSGSLTMLWSIVGLIIVLSSYLLVDTFMNYLSGVAK